MDVFTGFLDFITLVCTFWEGTSCVHNHSEGLKEDQATAMAIWLARHGSGKNEIRKTAEKQLKYSLN